MNLFQQIKDENLRLAIIQSLAYKDLISFPDLGGDPDGGDEHAYEPDPQVRVDLLSQVDVPDALLLGLTSLEWSAGCDVQFAICSQWDGEDDFFDVQTLGGIEVLTALEELHIQMRSFKDLSPLTALQSLERLSVEGTKPFDALAPLLALPALREVSLYASAPDAKQVREALTQRGASVTIPDPKPRSFLP